MFCFFALNGAKLWLMAGANKSLLGLIEKVIEEYIFDLRDKNDVVQDHSKYTYRASSSGMCMRKNFYSSMTDVEEVKKPDRRTYRLFRLGDQVHSDIQNAFEQAVNKNKEYKI